MAKRNQKPKMQGRRRFAHVLGILMPVFMAACGTADDLEIEGHLGTATAALTFGTDDAPDSPGSAVKVVVGGTFSDEINTEGDVDWIKFYQTSNTLTQVRVEGADCTAWYQTNLGYRQLAVTDRDPSPDGCLIAFTPSTSRWWFVKVQRFDGVYGPALVVTHVSGG